MKKKSVRFGAGDLIIHSPASQPGTCNTYLLLDRFAVPVGNKNPPVNRYFWHLFDTTRQKRISMYEKKMRHEIKKNSHEWQHVKKSQPL